MCQVSEFVLTLSIKRSRQTSIHPETSRNQTTHLNDCLGRSYTAAREAPTCSVPHALLSALSRLF